MERISCFKKYLFLALFFITSMGYAESDRFSEHLPSKHVPSGCANQEIILANKMNQRIEVYYLRDPRRLIKDSDLLWQSPRIPGLSEAKKVSYRGQTAVLTTTDNGVIIYSYPGKQVLFHKEITGDSLSIHSAMPMDNGNVLLLETEKQRVGILYPDGHRVTQPTRETFWYRMHYPHGLIRDSHGTIYVAGYLDVIAFVPKGQGRNMTLIPKTDYSLNRYYQRCQKYGICGGEDADWEDGAHDFYPVKNSVNKFFLTTGERAFIFDSEKNPVVESRFPRRIPITLEKYEPLYELDSRYSEQEQRRAHYDRVILRKSGIKSISGSLSPNQYCVVAHAAPWLTNHLNYPYNGNFLLYADNPDAEMDYDITSNDHITFEHPSKVSFYKARLFY